MDRHAVFVDAGYLLVAAGELCCGQKGRQYIHCDYPALVPALIAEAFAHCSQPVLRLYWYDAARELTPTVDHATIGSVANAKVRLGRLVNLRQKGVDTLIVRDLMTLARERAISTAYLISGDEDLREGVVAAQDMGVRVVLVGVDVAAGHLPNQAKTLMRECDDVLILDRAKLEPYFKTTEATRVVEPGSQLTVDQAAQDFASRWLSNTTEDEQHRLLGQAPKIPWTLDAQLLQHAELSLGMELRGREVERRELRSAFWKHVRAAHEPR